MFSAFETLGAPLAALWRFLRQHRPPAHGNGDLSRSLIIIGPEQNADECVLQRRALKPLLFALRHHRINVIEIYGHFAPRRNGQPVSWMHNRRMRQSLMAGGGFHLICIDDEGEIAFRGRMPMSEPMLAELINGQGQPALPAPAPATEQRKGWTETPKKESETPQPILRRPAPPPSEEPATAPAQPNSWSVGVLR